MIRKFAVSDWTVGLVTIVAAAAHAWWLSRSDHAGEVLSGFGATLVVLGIWVAARPYIRNGLQSSINAALPRYGYGFIGSTNSASEHRKRVEKAKPGVVRDVWAERVIAVAVIAVGTLLNGYGTPIARVLGMRI